MIIVWKWKANPLDWKGLPGVWGVETLAPFTSPPDPSLFGRPGWVGFINGKEPKIEKTKV
jgi:hypothetical protein